MNEEEEIESEFREDFIKAMLVAAEIGKLSVTVDIFEDLHSNEEECKKISLYAVHRLTECITSFLEKWEPEDE